MRHTTAPGQTGLGLMLVVPSARNPLKQEPSLSSFSEPQRSKHSAVFTGRLTLQAKAGISRSGTGNPLCNVHVPIAVTTQQPEGDLRHDRRYLSERTSDYLYSL